MSRDRHLKDRILKEKKAQTKFQNIEKQSPPENQSSNLFGVFLSSVGNQQVARFLDGGMIQAKLDLSTPGDAYERQADSIAQQMVHMKPNAEPLKAKINTVQAKGGSSGSVPGETEKGIKQLSGKGSSLSKPVREFFEPRLGVDLGNVKVHTDPKSNALARSVNARAFTYQNQIVFGKGQYNPSSQSGKRLLGHELTHVVQQNPSQKIFRETIEPEAVDRKPKDFDPQKEATKLKKALEGFWGVDERTVFNILYTGRKDLTQSIEAAYNEKNTPDLRTILNDKLYGSDLDKALSLLDKGYLTLTEKIREFVMQYENSETGEQEYYVANKQKVYHDLERAGRSESSVEELEALKQDSDLYKKLSRALPPKEWKYIARYLQGGTGILAAQLLDAVTGWGTDEDAIWLAIEQANEEERESVRNDPDLMERVREDLTQRERIRFEQSLLNEFNNLYKIEMACKGCGTDENQLFTALESLSKEEFMKLKSSETPLGNILQLKELLKSELSGRDEEKANQILYQKQIQFEPGLKNYEISSLYISYKEDGATAIELLIAPEGETVSIIGKLIIAAAGAGTDEKTIFNTLNSLTSKQRKFIIDHDPCGIKNILMRDLSPYQWSQALNILEGSVTESIKTTIINALEAWGTDERQIYDAIDRALKEASVAECIELSNDKDLEFKMMDYGLSYGRAKIFQNALKEGKFKAMQRFEWATIAAPGTDEDLVYELCGIYKDGYEDETAWYIKGDEEKEGYVREDIDKILKKELCTTDYWKALDILRPAPKTDEERIARASEQLERERGEGNGLSRGIMDIFSYSGQNADDALREYRSDYYQAIEDGLITEDERELIDQDEKYSAAMLDKYREAKATVAQWASTIAVAIIGTVATIFAGPLGPAFVIAMMGAGAFTKVAVNKIVMGASYDVTSTQALVDALSGAVEVGLAVVGGQFAKNLVAGKGSVIAGWVGKLGEKIGPKAANMIAASIEGGIDGAIGGLGEGIIQGLASEETWANGPEGFVANMAKTTFITGGLSTLTGAVVAPVIEGIKLHLDPSGVHGPRVDVDGPRRIQEVEVKFKNNDFDADEFTRQLKLQEEGINKLTVGEYLENRRLYLENGRSGASAQKAAREEALRNKMDELIENGVPYSQAKEQATEWLSSQAALHSPDQVAGGNPFEITGVGDSNVNSSLGSQWRYRIEALDEQIREFSLELSPEELNTVLLNVKLVE